MSEDIDVRVTPSLHPRVIEEQDYWDDDTAVFLAPTQTAFSEAYVAIGKVHDARAAANKNLAWTEEARLIMVDDFAQKQFARVARIMDSTAASLSKSIAALETELSAPVTVKAAQSVSAEIRNHAKAMPTGERLTFVREAIERGDETTVTALLGAPHYLSGFETADLHATMLRQWHERSNPVKAKRLRAMQGAFEMIGQRGPLVFGQLEKAVGVPPHKVKKLREAKTAAERALVMQES